MQQRSISFLFFVFWLIFVPFQPLVAQKWYEEKAEKHNQNKAYVDVVAIYETLIQNGVTSEQILKRTADAYFFQGDYRSAYPKYKLLFRRYPNNLHEEHYLRYLHSLKSVNRYNEASNLLKQFKAKFPDELAQEDYTLHYLQKIEAKTEDYSIGVTAINSLEMDYAPSYYQNKIVFTSARDTGNFKKNRHQWDDSPFTQLYVAEMDKRTKELSQVKKFTNQLNTQVYHESSTCFTKDAKTVFFTRNAFINNERSTNIEGQQILKIYKASFVDGTWQNIEELPFNSNEFNTAHPTLSPDEDYLYFASDRPGGFGKADIWRVKLLEKDLFGEPENLGKPVNTSGTESFPFMAYNNILYFASNLHLGLGGLDLFAAEKQPDQSFAKITNLGAGINSKFDDFALIIDSSLTGFFSTNRSVGKYKRDNIYRIKQRYLPNFDDLLIKEIRVIDEENGENLAKVKFEIYNSSYQKIKLDSTDVNGNVSLSENKDVAKMYLRFIRENYEVKEIPISKSVFLQKDTLIVPLAKRMKAVALGKDIGKIIEIEKIYFDLDEYVIRPDAAIELAKIVSVLKSYPDVSIEIGSHTDSRASKSYNQKLSQNRAQSTKEWIIKNGISENRITAKGYGESKIVNHCKDDVDCSEKEHQQNRRSEFIITEIKDK